MFQLKVTLALLLVFGGAGTYLYLEAGEAATQAAQDQVEAHLGVAARALTLAWKADAQALRVQAEGLAASPTLRAALARTAESFTAEDGTVPPPDEVRYQIHRLVNDELRGWKEPLAASERGAPDFLAVVDPAGLGVGRAGDPAWFGPEANLAQEQAGLAAALAAAGTTHGMWQSKDAPLEVVVAPVRTGEQVLGAVVVGYRLNLTTARRSKALTAAEVAWFVGDHVAQSSSFSPERELELARALAEKGAHRTTGTADVTLGGHHYRAQVGHVGEGPWGFLVLLDLDSVLAESGRLVRLIPVVFGAGFLLSVLLTLFFFMRWMKPFEGIERGIMELINDNKDHWFEGKGGDLAARLGQNLNIMVCHLTGRPLPEDHDRPG